MTNSKIIWKLKTLFHLKVKRLDVGHMSVFITCRVKVRNGMDINAMDEERGRVHADLMGKESAKHLHIPKASTNTSVTHTDTRNNKSGPHNSSTTSDDVDNKMAKICINLVLFGNYQHFKTKGFRGKKECMNISK